MFAHANWDTRRSTVYGGEGNDQMFSVNKLREKIYGGAGNDSIVHLVTIPTTIEGAAVDGGKGDDLIITDQMRSYYQGGEGNDTVDFRLATGAINVNLLGMESQGIENLIGGKHNDTLAGAAGDNFLKGGEGNDTLTARGGNDTLIGGLGDDRLIADTLAGDSTQIDATQGHDTVELGNGSHVVLLGTESDQTEISTRTGQSPVVSLVLRGVDFEDLQVSKVGSDVHLQVDGKTLAVLKGVTPQLMTFGNNKIVSRDVAGFLNGRAAGQMGNFNIEVGTEFDDVLLGNAAANTLAGGKGADTLAGGRGADLLKGGEGNDTYRYALGDGRDVIEDLKGQDTLQLAGGITASQLEYRKVQNDLFIFVRPAGNTGSLSSLTDRIQVKGYFNEVNRLETIKVGETAVSHDHIVTTVAANPAFVLSDLELYQGGAGDDVFRGGSNPVSRTMIGGGGRDGLFGGAGNDYLMGEEGNDHLSGGKGDDFIHGGKGNDVISGGRGENTLLGASGNDSISGGDDKDVIMGGTGNDTLTGRAGNDTYNFLAGHGSDIIDDSSGEDTLNLGYELKDLVFNKSGNDLRVLMLGQNDHSNLGSVTDQVIIKDFYNGHGIEHINAGGRELATGDIGKLVQATATFLAQNGGNVDAVNIDAKRNDLANISVNALG